MKKFKIYRDSWLHGERNSSLHRPVDKKECCLGQVCAQMGIPVKYLVGEATPFCVYPPKNTELDSFRDTLLHDNYLGRILLANDQEKVPNREKTLTGLFSEMGYEVEFVDGLAPWIDAQE